MCELCVLPWDGTPGRVGPCALDPPLPPPGPVQAVIIGLAGSELHYLPWPTRAWGGPGACEPVRLGAGRGVFLPSHGGLAPMNSSTCLRQGVAKGPLLAVPTLAPQA